MLRLIALCMISLMAFGCDNTVMTSKDVEARVTESAILLTNKTGKTIYYFVVGRKASALIDWYPVVSDENAILADETITIERSAVDPDGVETEVLVYWWDAVIVDNMERPGEVQHFIVPLPNNPFAAHL